MKLRFKKAIDAVRNLEKDARYFGAFIFGSVARGEAGDASDLDVKVLVDNGNCENINHPFIHGVKLDITFLSLGQLEEVQERIVKKGERIPMLAESVILFDKTGGLTELKKKYQKIRPKKYAKKEYNLAQFGVFHADDKIKRAFEKNDFRSTELGMHMNLGEILKVYYRIKGRWWVSDKRLFADLELWDTKLAKLLELYLLESNIQHKYQVWTKMIEHILKPIGGRKGIREINCNCESCKRDLARLVK